MKGHYKSKRTFDRAFERAQERCGRCEHLMCFPALLLLKCHEGDSIFKEECPHFLDANEHMARNKGNPPMKPIWREEYAVVSGNRIVEPFCPSCGEFADLESGHCRFCGQPFAECDDPRPKRISVEIVHDGHRHVLTQVPQYNSLWYSVDGQHRLHTSGSEKAKTEGELMELLQKWIDTNFPDNLLG